MDDVDFAVERGGLPENQLFFVGFNLAGQVFQAFEPYEFQFSAFVIGSGGHTLAFSCPHHFQVTDACFDLDVRELWIQFLDGVNARTVDIAVGDMV